MSAGHHQRVHNWYELIGPIRPRCQNNLARTMDLPCLARCVSLGVSVCQPVVPENLDVAAGCAAKICLKREHFFLSLPDRVQPVQGQWPWPQSDRDPCVFEPMRRKRQLNLHSAHIQPFLVNHFAPAPASSLDPAEHSVSPAVVVAGKTHIPHHQGSGCHQCAAENEMRHGVYFASYSYDANPTSGGAVSARGSAQYFGLARRQHVADCSSLNSPCEIPTTIDPWKLPSASSGGTISTRYGELTRSALQLESRIRVRSFPTISSGVDRSPWLPKPLPARPLSIPLKIPLPRASLGSWWRKLDGAEPDTSSQLTFFPSRAAPELVP